MSSDEIPPGQAKIWKLRGKGFLMISRRKDGAYVLFPDSRDQDHWAGEGEIVEAPVVPEGARWWRDLNYLEREGLTDEMLFQIKKLNQSSEAAKSRRSSLLVSKNTRVGNIPNGRVITVPSELLRGRDWMDELEGS